MLILNNIVLERTKQFSAALINSMTAKELKHYKVFRGIANSDTRNFIKYKKDLYGV